MTAPADVGELTEHLFRREAGKLVSALTNIFGLSRLQLAEDVVQDALIRALQTWPYYGVPQNPAAWLMQTARNLALDTIRREKNFREKEEAIIATLDGELAAEEPRFADEMRDGRLRLIFACCHPFLAVEDQCALALKTLCGFSSSEIASAFLSTEVAIAKRLTRARARLQEASIPFEIPAGPELANRLGGVLHTIYLLFNEGYKASAGAQLVRTELCFEAIHLAKLLAEHPATNEARVHALLALMLLSTARLETRLDAAGNLLRLRDQDRTRWDHALIALGLQHLTRAGEGHVLSEYHLQAGIAAFHATAPDYASTDWRAILDHYDRWMTLSGSAVVALNRAVAIAEVEGPAAAIKAIEEMRNRHHLDRYYLTYAVLGDLASRLGRPAEAAAHFRRALELTQLDSEQAFLEERLRECTG